MFLVASPIAAAALLVVLFLREVPLRGPGGPPKQEQKREPTPETATPRAMTTAA